MYNDGFAAAVNDEYDEYDDYDDNDEVLTTTPQWEQSIPCSNSCM